jgi:hypothetical protein
MSTPPLPLVASALFQSEGHLKRAVVVAKNVLHLCIQLMRSLIDEFEMASFELSPGRSVSFEAVDIESEGIFAALQARRP